MQKALLVFGIAAIVLKASSAKAAENRDSVFAPHIGDLVVLHAEKLVPFEAKEFPKAPYSVLYFGAGWCPDCRRFSPSLVDAYRQQPGGKKLFEVVLFSMDKNAEGMLRFMKTEAMTWPALAFDRIGAAEDLKKLYSGHGIPCLSVIDRKGKLVLQSKSDQDAQEVLKALLELPREPRATEP